jgi:plastocyanin
MTVTRTRSNLFYVLALAAIAVMVLLPVVWGDKQVPAGNAAVLSPASSDAIRDIHIFTVEFKTKQDGKEKEVYRWDPETVILHKGETVRLHFHGFQGKEHVFSILGLGVQTTVRKGETVTVTVKPHKAGTFKLVCHTHETVEKHGPMIGYVTVLEK